MLVAILIQTLQILHNSLYKISSKRVLYSMPNNYIILNYVCMINCVGICYGFKHQIGGWNHVIAIENLGLLILLFSILLSVFGKIADYRVSVDLIEVTTA